jgi:CheY-like chemotaxis protein
MAAQNFRQILVVEDDRFLRAWMKIALEYARYALTSAASGPEVFELIDRGLRPELVLLDVPMPATACLEDVGQALFQRNLALSGDLANAGHSVVSYLLAGASPQILEAEGPPLGLFPDDDYVQSQLTLSPEDVLALCSDGFAKATRGEDDMFGDARLTEIIRAHVASSVRATADARRNAGSNFATGCEQHDDQTGVILKGTGQ